MVFTKIEALHKSDKTPFHQILKASEDISSQKNSVIEDLTEESGVKAITEQ